MWGGKNISAERSQPYFLDVTQPHATKGFVVLMLSSMTKIPAAHVATIGDMPNDMLMFKKSAVSIAMGNAGQRVQKAATYVEVMTTWRVTFAAPLINAARQVALLVEGAGKTQKIQAA